MARLNQTRKLIKHSKNKKHNLFLLIFGCILFSVFSLMVIATRVNACSTAYPPGVPSPTPPNIADRTKAATIVLEGMITKVNLRASNQNDAVLEVYRYFKGSGPKIVKLIGFGPAGSCNYVPSFERSVFYATGDPNIELTAFFLVNGRAAEPIDPKTISEVIAITGQNPITPIDNEQKIIDPLLIVIGLIAGIVVLGLAGTIFWKRRRTN